MDEQVPTARKQESTRAVRDTEPKPGPGVSFRVSGAQTESSVLWPVGIREKGCPCPRTAGGK